MNKFDPCPDEDWEHRKEEVLYQLLYHEHMTIREISEELSTSDSVIRDWMSRYNIKKPIKNPHYLETEYNKGNSAKEIAEEINQHWTEVYAKIDQYGLNNGN